MIILEFEGQTRVLNAPAGWDAAQPIKCGMLPVADVAFDGVPAMVSFWKPEPHELEQLNAGAHIRLVVYGRGHPPVSLDVLKCLAVSEQKPEAPR